MIKDTNKISQLKLVTIDKVSTGQTYTNININFGILNEALSKKCEVKNSKIPVHLYKKYSKEARNILGEEFGGKLNPFILSGVSSILKSLIILDDNVSNIETMIQSSKRKTRDSAEEINARAYTLPSIIIESFGISVISDIKLANANAIAVSIEKLLIDNFNKTLKIVDNSSISVICNIVEKCDRLNHNYSSYVSNISYKDKNDTELNKENIEQIKQILSNIDYSETVVDIYASKVKIGKSYDFPTKNRYVVITDIDEYCESIREDIDYELKMCLSVLKSVAINYRSLVGATERRFKMFKKETDTDNVLVKQYFFEIPVEHIGKIETVNNLINCRMLHINQIKLRESLKEVKKLLDKCC